MWLSSEPTMVFPSSGEESAFTLCFTLFNTSSGLEGHRDSNNSVCPPRWSKVKAMVTRLACLHAPVVN